MKPIPSAGLSRQPLNRMGLVGRHKACPYDCPDAVAKGAGLGGGRESVVQAVDHILEDSGLEDGGGMHTYAVSAPISRLIRSIVSGAEPS